MKSVGAQSRHIGTAGREHLARPGKDAGVPHAGCMRSDQNPRELHMAQ